MTTFYSLIFQYWPCLATLASAIIQGVKGRIGRCIYIFLTNRKQEVVVQGYKSGTISMISGIPQGSELGPILFLIYISDIGEKVKSNMNIYVDYSKTKENIKKTEDVELLQENIYQLYLWGEENNIKFNSTKFQVLRFGMNEGIKEETNYFTEK